jgi:hypothetical protein
MKSPKFPFLSVYIIAALSVMLACATLQDLIGQPCKTFELTIDGEKVIVNLPKEFPSMDIVISGGERCWDTKLCAQQFCLSDEVIHGHVRFFYSGKNIVALGWWDKEGNERHWLYKEGIFTEVDYEKLRIFLDSLWKDPPSKQEGTV